MRVLGCLIRYVAILLNAVGRVFERGGFILNGLLPAILPSRDLTSLIQQHYDRSYAEAAIHFSDDLYEWALESWEEEVLARHGIQSGRILVLGAGVGRESVALAKRGLQVVGLDISREALQVAVHAADRAGAKALFVQADFLHLPFTAASVRYVLLSGIMYSAIPGRRQRQVWLRSLRAHLQDNGLVLLNFLIERWSATRSRRIIEAVNRVLAALPGANAAYQQGDTCAQSHFLHVFRNEAEIREELREAGVNVVDLNWARGYAVVSFEGCGGGNNPLEGL